MKKVYQFTGQQVFVLLLTDLLKQKIIPEGNYKGTITCHRNGLVELEVELTEKETTSVVNEKSNTVLDSLFKMLTLEKNNISKNEKV